MTVAGDKLTWECRLIHAKELLMNLAANQPRLGVPRPPTIEPDVLQMCTGQVPLLHVVTQTNDQLGKLNAELEMLCGRIGVSLPACSPTKSATEEIALSDRLLLTQNGVSNAGDMVRAILNRLGE